MILMKNSLFNWDFSDKISHVIDKTANLEKTYYISDYTSKNFKSIVDYPEFGEHSTYIDYYYLRDGQTIEQVSYELYSDEKYWDLLLLINKKDPLFGMVYPFDNLRDHVKTEISNYNTKFYKGLLPAERLNALGEEMFAEIYLENEQKRQLKIIRKEHLPRIVMKLRLDGFIA